MDAKIVLLLLLGVSFLFLGCAKKGAETKNISAASGEEEIGEETGEGTVEVEQDEGQADAEKELADLFQIDTDKPLGDEGLDIGAPSSD